MIKNFFWPMPREHAASSYRNFVHSQFTPSALVAVVRVMGEKIAVVESLWAPAAVSQPFALAETRREG
jgi:hypothetical protein